PAQALVHPRRNVITRALGTGQIWEPDVIVVPAVPGQRLLMCSDGLTGELSPAHIARVLHSVPHPKEAADVLVQAALRTGGRDNVTLVVADVLRADDPRANPTSIPRIR
ncbi:UNVERIFIED_CONTAM: SpoIIE family protein phosphatase, partial [Acinetobacter sp. HSTU-ASm16]